MDSKIKKHSELGNRIREAVDKSGKKQADFAELLGVHPSNLNRWIQGEVAPSYDYLTKIGNLSGVSLDWLLTGEGSQYREEKNISSDILAGVMPDENDTIKNLIKKLEQIYVIGEDTEKAFVRGIIDHIYDKTVRLNLLKTIKETQKKEEKVELIEQKKVG